MIAKRVKPSGSISDYKALASYILDVREEERDNDPSEWSLEEGDRLTWAQATNCGETAPAEAVVGILGTHAGADGSNKDKFYHLVFSFPEDDQLKRWHLDRIEDRLVSAVGLGDKPRVSSAHGDTGNTHVHVAISLVDPATHEVAKPVADYFKLQAACVEIERDYGLTEEPHTLTPEASRDRRADKVRSPPAASPFLSWVQENAGKALLAARDSDRGWQGMHETAAAHGLLLERQRGGMVITNVEDRRARVKASSVDPGLGFGAVTKVLGEFEPARDDQQPTPQASAPEQAPDREGQGYSKTEPPKALWQAFMKDRDKATKARKEAIEALRPRHIKYARQLTHYYREKLTKERGSELRGPLRREAFDHILDQRDKDHTARREWETEERRKTKAAHEVPTWQTWLESRAASGDMEALGELRSRQQRIERLGSDLIMASDPEAVSHIVKTHLKPTMRSNGSVVYEIPDASLVIDGATQVRVPKPSEAAALLALTLASERFGHRPLVVQGTQAFRTQVADLAGEKGMSVTFADRKLESIRVQATRSHARNDERGNETRDSLHTDMRKGRTGDLTR